MGKSALHVYYKYMESSDFKETLYESTGTYISQKTAPWQFLYLPQVFVYMILMSWSFILKILIICLSIQSYLR